MKEWKCYLISHSNFGTYIGAIYLEVKNRPHYIIDKVIAQETSDAESEL